MSSKKYFWAPPPAYVHYFLWCCIFVPHGGPKRSSRSGVRFFLDFFFAPPQIIFIYPSGTNLRFPKIFLLLKNTKCDDYDDTRRRQMTHEVTKERLGGAIPPECIIRCQKWRFLWKSIYIFRYERFQKIIWQKFNLEHFFLLKFGFHKNSFI